MRRMSHLAVSAVSLVALGSAAMVGTATAADASSTQTGRHRAVYVLSNQTSGNEVLVYDRHRDGRLSATGQYPTGGTGTGAGLGSQNAVVLDQSGNHLFAVNAGSNTITSFEVTARGLRRLSTLSSGGTTPISLSVRDDLVYVLNAGGDGSISGFENRRGVLRPLPRSTRALSGATANPAQVSITPDGRQLVVTEKGTQLIDVYRLDKQGLASSRTSILSSGATPFGFDFTPTGRLVVSEAGPSAASTYRVLDYGLQAISSSVPNTEAAACWLKVTGDGRFAYTGNGGGSQSVSGYRVRRDGTLSLLDVDGRTGTADAGVSDLALSHGDRYLYARVGNGTIGAFEIAEDGSLSPLPSGTGVPAGSAGIAAY